MDEKDFLKHVGVIGMKWGVRKASDSGGNSNGVGKGKTKLSDAELVSVLKKRKNKDLSNAELKAITSRLELEKKLSDLSPSKVTKVKKFVGDVLTNASKTALTKKLASEFGAKLDSVMSGKSKRRASRTASAADDILKDFAKKYKNNKQKTYGLGGG